jgi:hypothetical protein
MSPPPTAQSYSASSGVAEKGPLIKGSTVTAQQLDATLAPTGQQFSYQTTSDLGAFAPTSTFTSRYIGLNANGYYFDEVAGDVSAGQITLTGYSDLGTDSVLNVNLLTTLAYQRIQNLVKEGKSFASARTQAESEVLTALSIPPGSYGSFGTLDLSGTSDGDHILAAISSLFVYGNAAGELSQLIANFQSDIATSGMLANQATKDALVRAAQHLSPQVVAANLKMRYASAGVDFKAADIADWIAPNGDGVVSKFSFEQSGVDAASTFTVPAAAVSQFAGDTVSLSAGDLQVNGTTATGTVMLHAGDVITVSPGTATSSAGILTVYLQTGTTRLARIDFIDHGVWTVTGSMSFSRTSHSATLLADGTVLVAGGWFNGVESLSSSETYDSASRSWISSGPMATARASHTATLLSSGKVLVTGGEIVNLMPIASAETYDPAVRKWTPAGTMSSVRSHHTATRLADGRVLVCGGMIPDPSSSGLMQNITATAGAEIYDPITGVWTPTASLTEARYDHTATLLGNGQVLITGGRAPDSSGMQQYSSSSELYDPASGTWTAGTFPGPRALHTATLLANGTVLVTGGLVVGNGIFYLNAADLYDPAAKTWVGTGSMLQGRAGNTATLLPNGKVMVTGIDATQTTSTEVYDPTLDAWSQSGSPIQGWGRDGHTATLLLDGTVLVAGGGGVSNAEIYH